MDDKKYTLRRAAKALGIAHTTLLAQLQALGVKPDADGLYTMEQIAAARDSSGYVRAESSETSTGERIRAAKAALLELELAQKRGEIIDVKEAQAIYARCAGLVRQRLLSLPSQIAPHLVGVDLATAEERMTAAIRSLLEEIADELTK